MSSIFKIPRALREFADECSSVEAKGATVGDALKWLLSLHEELRPHLCASDGQLRQTVHLYLNGRDVVDQAGLETSLSGGGELSIVPGAAGASGASPPSPLSPEALASLPELDAAEIRRYSRHLIMPEVAMEGQERLKAAKVLLVGTGGLGSPSGMYLAAAGVGTIGLVDFDVVDESNLHRQVLFGEADVGRPKLEAATERLKQTNPHVSYIEHAVRLDSSNALEILRGYDLVVDGTDNFPTRYLVNDACVLLGIPNVYGSIFRFEGQVSVFWGTEGPCYRCLFAEPPPPGLVPSCAEGGVLGVLPGIIGSLQANEAIKLILGAGDSMVGRLLLFDALRMSFRELKLKKNPNCPVCSATPSLTELIDYDQFCGLVPSTEEDEAELDISVEELHRRLVAGDSLQLVDVRTPEEREICRIEGALPIPMGDLESRFNELDPERTIVVHCHHGPRSTRATRLLRENGFESTWNLAGGIDAWSERIDETIPRY